MKKQIVIAAVVLMAFASLASAAENTATLTVTGTIESTILLTIESAGGSTSGLGSAAASSDLGNIGRFDVNAPAGFTHSKGSGDWTISSSMTVNVEKANLDSANYTLSAQLLSAPATGVAWKLGGSTLSDTLPSTLTGAGVYGSSAASYDWDIVIADSAAAGSIDNIINFTAVSN
jgi:hypothetical protein